MAGTSIAPMDEGALRAALAPFGRSQTLPAEAYTSAAVFEWEKEHFFERSWVCVGRSTDLSRPGDRKAVHVGAESVVLVRDERGELRAFYNVCRHRGHELVANEACTNATVIQCPYHAWVYGLDGKLKGAPHYNELPEFERADYPLVDVPVAEWGGWTFINASGTAAAFATHVGNLGEFIDDHEPERLVSAERHEYTVNANWKIIHENYHECYHCSQIHPELCRVTSPDSGVNLDPLGAWVGGDMDLLGDAETMSLTGRSNGHHLPKLQGEALRHVSYFGLWPNLLISPHPDYVMTHVIIPEAPDRSRIMCEWLFAPEEVALDEFDPSYASDFWDITNKQDWAACEAVQRGATSRGYRQGPLAPAEEAVYQFITMVARGYSGQDITRHAPLSTTRS